MLWPFFCFYGGKWRVAPHYPIPKFRIIIEPFAGSAGYSMRHPEHDVHLYDIDPIIYGVWNYLIKSTPSEIRDLPTEVFCVNDLNVCQEAKWLIGFWLNKGVASPCQRPSQWMRDGIRPNSFWGSYIRERIARQVNAIKHWKIFNKSYREIEPSEATWFIDPPYSTPAGRCYKFSTIDYKSLAEWSKDRRGQIIVCEQDGASWLPFKTFRTIKANEGGNGKKQSKEVIWTNFQPTTSRSDTDSGNACDTDATASPLREDSTARHNIERPGAVSELAVDTKVAA